MRFFHENMFPKPVYSQPFCSTASNGIVIATERKSSSILIDDAVPSSVVDENACGVLVLGADRFARYGVQRSTIATAILQDVVTVRRVADQSPRTRMGRRHTQTQVVPYVPFKILDQRLEVSYLP